MCHLRKFLKNENSTPSCTALFLTQSTINKVEVVYQFCLCFSYWGNQGCKVTNVTRQFSLPHNFFILETNGIENNTIYFNFQISTPMMKSLYTIALTLGCIATLASSQTCGRPSGISSLLSNLFPSSQIISPSCGQEYIIQGPSYAVSNPTVATVPYVPRQIPVVPNSQVYQTGPQLVSNVGYQVGPQLATVASLPGVLSKGCGTVPAVANAPVVANYPNGKSCGCSAPAPLVNPYLPSQSPVSALAPTTSNCLPAMIPTGSRSNYLRKIPIPPPSCWVLGL